MKGIRVLIFLIFLVLIYMRIVGLWLNLYNDEIGFALEASDGFKNFGRVINVHPPISNFFYSIAGELFGNSNFAIRFMPFVFSMLTLIIVYLLSMKIYNDKWIALNSVFLLLVSFWHTLTSIQVDIDGAILSFIISTVFYCYISYEKTNNIKWLFFTGIFFGIALLTKLPAIIIILIILVYILLARVQIKIIIKRIAIISIIGLLLFSIFPIYSYFVYPEYFPLILKHSSSNRANFSFLPLIYFLIWGTPLFVIILISAVIYQIKKITPQKDNTLLVAWSIIPIIFYIFVGNPYQSPYERYLAIVMPPLAIFGGMLLKKHFNPKYFFLFVISLIISLTINFVTNLSTNYIPHNINTYFFNMINLNWNFYFPITGSSGPMFGINFSSLALIFIVSAILFFISLHRNYQNYFLPILLGLIVGFNLFLTEEFIFHGVHPNFDRAVSDVKTYFIENKMRLPIYTNQLSYLYYLNLYDDFDSGSRKSDNAFWFAFNSPKENAEDMQKRISERHGTVMLVDYPILNKCRAH